MNAAERATIERHARHLSMLDSTVAKDVGRELLQLAAKPGGKTKPRACPAAKAALSVCTKLTGAKVESPHESTQRARYLDTFPADERHARAARLEALPVYAQFAYEGTPKGMKDDAARLWLTGRMDQFERDDAAERVRAVAAHVREECRVLQAWAMRNRPERARYRWYSTDPTAQWPREEALAA